MPVARRAVLRTSAATPLVTAAAMIATGTFREDSPVNSLWSAAALFVVIAAWRDVRDLPPTRLDGGQLLVVPVAVALMGAQPASQDPSDTPYG